MKLRLKKNEDRRLRAGHLWIYSNEIDTLATPLKNFEAGQEVIVEAYDKTPLGIAYVNPQSLIIARLLARNPKKEINTAFFVKKLQTALQLRNTFFKNPYYRWVFAESDSLPGLIIDRYGQTLVMQINTKGLDVKKDMIIEAIKEVLPECESILLRNDSSSRLQEGLTQTVEAALGQPPEKILLEENNACFEAPIWTGQKTGWFYDHRMNRLRLKDYVSGTRVLDVFSYLGAFGIQAALQGATEVFCVDSSSLSADWIAANAALNHVSDKVKVITDDAFEALKNLLKNHELFDVVVLDPPAFVKKQKDKKEGFIAYQRINELALKLLKKDGILFSCSCSMHVSQEDFIQILRRAGLHAGCEMQILERGHQAVDHPVHVAIPETDYLKMVIARKI